MKRFFAILLACMLGVLGSSAYAAESNTNPATSGGTMSTNPKILIETSKGNITAELDAKAAPKTVENILAYVNDGFYTDTVFHRVIPGFMIQGGGMNADMTEKTTKASIQNESYNGLKNTRGTLAMARTNNPNSATSQFFINTVDNDFLNKSQMNAGYAVFGKVTKGMDVVDKITQVPTANLGMHQNVPKQAIKIVSMTIKAAPVQK